MTEQEAQLPTIDEIREWLEQADPEKDLPRFYFFLSKIALLSLINLKIVDLESAWSTQRIKHTYTIFKIPLVLAYISNNSEIKSIESHISNDARLCDSASSNTSNAIVSRASACITHIARAARSTKPVVRACDVVIANDINMQDYFLGSEEIINAWQVCIGNRDEMGFNKTTQEELIEVVQKLSKFDLSFLQRDLIKQIEQEEIETQILDLYIKKLDGTAYSSSKILKAALFGEQVKQHTIRCLLVGPGGAGKTNLFQLLTNQKIASYNSATEKISQQLITDCEDWLESKNNDTKINIQLWDFAGQTQYYGLHQSFFTNRCIYVLVVDSRHEQSPYEWLYQISHIANQNTKVLIVINEYEGCPAQLNQTDMIERFNGLLTKESFITINLSPESDMSEAVEFKSLKNKIALNALSEQTVMSKAVADLYDELLQEEAELIDHSEMIKNAEDSGIEWNEDEVEAVLKHLGLFIKNEQEEMWLSTKWLNNSSYSFFNKLDDKKKIHKKVHLRKQKIDGLDCLLDFIQQTNLCVEVKNKGFIFPSVLPKNTAEKLIKLKESRFHIKETYKKYGEFCIHLNHLPMGTFAKWLGSWIKELQITEDDFSRYSCVIRSNNSDIALAVEWHPYLKLLTFTFWQPAEGSFIEEHSENFRNCMGCLYPYYKQDIQAQSTSSNILGTELVLTQKVIDTFLTELPNLQQHGVIHAFQNKNQQGVQQVTNITAQQYVGDNANIKMENVTFNQTINQIDNSEQESLVELISLIKPMLGELVIPSMVPGTQKGMEKLEQQIQQGKCPESAKSILDSSSELIQGVAKTYKSGEKVAKDISALHTTLAPLLTYVATLVA